ncbi:hypothetical protein M422DRAFT_57012 [Sphaerobolus stellatus SS14]|uniref:Uncharacterized protein n=1 Tax=Sphaerobolus stellatus (strain SS14) TaxID=990650 RepID=A0A0C9UBX9_SPHS4|nr:hypothetical protein M422DRAFT_57012 [Sphaerobolus stellatus SS14]
MYRRSTSFHVALSFLEFHWGPNNISRRYGWWPGNFYPEGERGTPASPTLWNPPVFFAALHLISIFFDTYITKYLSVRPEDVDDLGSIRQRKHTKLAKNPSDCTMPERSKARIRARRHTSKKTPMENPASPGDQASPQASPQGVKDTVSTQPSEQVTPQAGTRYAREITSKYLTIGVTTDLDDALDDVVKQCVINSTLEE